jgi:hypothetical protein
MEASVEPDHIPGAAEKVEEEAHKHGVKPAADIRGKFADLWPEDESLDEFVATIRRWRDGWRALKPNNEK